MALLISRVQFITIALATFTLLYWFSHSSLIPSVQWNSAQCEKPSQIATNTTTTTTAEPNVPYSYINMNNDKSQLDANGEHTGHVLILTPFKQSVQFIDRFFDNVNKLTYPHHLISLGFLVSDSTDGTIEKLKERAEFESKAESWKKFNSIAIFQKDFKFELASNEDRHAFEVQVKRRTIMAKSRNTLLSAALNDQHEWVLWLDGDVTEYPETLLDELIGMDKDVIVPNCFWHSYNEQGGYDKNNWQETEASLEFQKNLPENQVLVEGKTAQQF
jgi:mannan polymerase complexes MNN9 subunit